MLQARFAIMVCHHGLNVRANDFLDIGQASPYHHPSSVRCSSRSPAGALAARGFILHTAVTDITRIILEEVKVNFR